MGVEGHDCIDRIASHGLFEPLQCILATSPYPEPDKSVAGLYQRYSGDLRVTSDTGMLLEDVVLAKQRPLSPEHEKKRRHLIARMHMLLHRMRRLRPMGYLEAGCRLQRVLVPFKLLGIQRVSSSMQGNYIRRRPNLPLSIVAVMKVWFEEHRSHPYPSQEEKEAFAQQGGIEQIQVDYWFTNARARYNK